MADLALSVANLGKCYQIYESPGHRLRQFFMPQLDRWLGRNERAYFKEFWALKDVSFQVGKGETVGIIGRNGSGKSTLLQMLCGILTPTTGTAEVYGRVSALLELGAGFNPDFTGRENVFLKAAILGLTRQQIAGRFNEIAAFADIGEFIDQPIKTYSSGMTVRLAFATAIHVSPDILVVDEALAVGDTAFQSKCLARIRRMQEEGVSILLVTHSTNTIIEYCDRAIYLKRGQMMADGLCKTVVEAYAADLVREERGTAAPLVAEAQPEPESKILRVWVEDARRNESTLIHQGERFQVKLRVRYLQNVLKPALGIQIKSVTDIELWTGTTLNLGISLGQVGAGDEREYSWSLDAAMGAGRYVVALGVGDTESGIYRRHFRLHYALHFDVIEDRPGGRGWLSPNPAVTESPLLDRRDA